MAKPHCLDIRITTTNFKDVRKLLFSVPSNFQVTSSMKDEGRQLIPSLGLSWSNHVTTRIMLARTNQTVTIQQDSVHGPLETVVREMEIVFAPHLPTMTVPYVIDYEGMKGFK